MAFMSLVPCGILGVPSACKQDRQPRQHGGILSVRVVKTAWAINTRFRELSTAGSSSLPPDPSPLRAFGSVMDSPPPTYKSGRPPRTCAVSNSETSDARLFKKLADLMGSCAHRQIISPDSVSHKARPP